MMKILFVNKVKEKIEEFQKEYGSSKTWIANKAGMTRQTLNSLENVDNPTVQSLIRLAYALNCSVNDLYYFEIVDIES